MAPLLQLVVIGPMPEGPEEVALLKSHNCKVTQVCKSSAGDGVVLADSVEVLSQVDGSLLVVASFQQDKPFGRTTGIFADYLLLPQQCQVQAKAAAANDAAADDDAATISISSKHQDFKLLPSVGLEALTPAAASERILFLGPQGCLAMKDLLRNRIPNQSESSTTAQDEEGETEKVVKLYTLVFVRCRSSKRVLLGLKKRGFGAGKWDGFGGKVEPGETVVIGAARELEEESGLRVKPEHLHYVGLLEFEYLSLPKLLQVHSYEVSVEEAFGSEALLPEATESEEMRPEWFSEANIPFDDMWQDSRWWVPPYLQGKHLPFLGRFRFRHHEGEESKVLLGFSLSSEQCSRGP
eukprot:CAMPEP_0194752836 /NCGR_PEP_ID=MMETSP0323_2-20130528/6726_1 /TAXON_ID=2866 ORGANISM="Crypthecodinium cohnii, Strain Seligo" /NCGR_SAMPLE_ID=MMETSP0323_2 /ASSEMBLY_ACC=CAM_ASM_000346 /LENGTH=351 /DNA_ID=CAMNT_0039670169 /DNA_START=1 /DNA_END=1056 /DNA_ORIENTATION=+